MTKIKLYNVDSTPTLGDRVIGSEMNNRGITKNYLLGDIFDLFDSPAVTGLGNEIISGAVYHIDNMDYGWTPFVYRIGGTLYEIPAGSTTLSDADPTFARADVFAVTDTPSMVVLEGTPATPALEPQVEFVSQIRVTRADIPALSSEPSNVSEELVFNENAGSPNEWDATKVDGSGSLSLSSSSDPQLDSLSIEATGNINESSITFSNAGYDFIDVSSINMYIKNKGTERWKFSLDLYNGTTHLDGVVVGDGDFGMDNSNITSYVAIDIPKTIFSADLSNVTKIVLSLKANHPDPDDFKGFYLDNVRLKEGTETPAQPRTWIGLLDTPSEYSSNKGKIPAVNPSESGIYFLQATSGTGTDIEISLAGGFWNTVVPLGDLTYTVSGATTVTGAWARTRIDASSEPSVTGATQEGGVEFVADTVLDLSIFRDDTGLKYYFSYPFTVSEGVGVVSVSKDGVVVDAAAEDLNFKGNVSVTQTAPGNVDVDIVQYENVSTIPSYIVADDGSSLYDTLPTVVDKTGTTGGYDILITDGGSINLSKFGAKADLTYLDVTTDGTTAVILNASFDQDDVGKNICIKKAHLNPDTATGSEVANTVLGRIVTVKAKILSVVDGVSATIDFTPNQAGVLRAYTYTNNAEAIYRAIRFAYYKGIQKLVVDYTGILGVDVRDKGIYDAVETYNGIVLKPSVGGLEITSESAKFKCCNEGDDGGIGFFNVESGSYNNGFRLDVPVLPADEFSQNPQGNEKIVLRVDAASNSVRDFHVSNQRWVPSDVDGNDSFWNKVIDGDSTGGLYSDGTRKSQRFFLEDNSARCKNGSYTNFQNDGYSNEMHFKDVYLNDIQHFDGERGREPYADNNANVMDWQFENGVNITGQFNVASNVITAPAGQDFSWYDWTENTVNVQATTTGGTASLVSITDAKTAVFGAGIADGNYDVIDILLESRNQFNHAMYLHPSMICTMVRCKSNDGPGNVKMYSDSGNVDSSIGRWDIYDSELYDIETLDGGTTSTAIVTNIENSTIKCYDLSGYVNIKDTVLSQAVFTGHHWNDLGGNQYPASNGSTSITVNDDDIIQVFDNVPGDLRFRYIGSNVRVEVIGGYIADNAFLPEVENGVMIYRDIEIPNQNMLSTFSYVGANTEMNFINFRQTYHDNNFAFLRNVGLVNPTIGRWENSQYYFSYKDPNLADIDPTGKNAGKMLVSTVPTQYFAVDAHAAWSDQWWSYKEPYWLSTSLLESNYWIVEDRQFSIFVNRSMPMRYTTNIGTNAYINAQGVYPATNMLPLLSGEFTLEFRGSTNVMDIYYHKNGAGPNNSSMRENTTFGNMVLKSLDRVDGEVAKFRVDPSQGRIIELSSNVDKKFSASKPTRLGVDGERLYKTGDETVYWEHQITFADDSGNTHAGTQTTPWDLDDAGANLIQRTHIDLNTPVEFSIGQEKTDLSDLKTFDFLLNISGGGTLTFEYDDTYDMNRLSFGGSISMRPELTKHFWAFKGTNNSYRCVMNNRTGQLLFEGTISETLDTTQILEIVSGDVITNREWVEVRTGVSKTKVTLTPAEVKSLGTTPITLIAGQGAGTIINVIEVTGRIVYGTTAHDNNSLTITTVGATNNFGTISGAFVNATSDEFAKWLPNSTGSQYQQLLENTAIEVSGTDSVATGDSPIDLYITYEILTL